MILLRLVRKAIKKKLHFYSIVISDNTLSPSSGRVIARVGWYSCLTDKLNNRYVYVDMDVIGFWLNRGGRLNKTLFSLIKSMMA
jgi:ribosomal protein S16